MSTCRIPKGRNSFLLTFWNSQILHTFQSRPLRAQPRPLSAVLLPASNPDINKTEYYWAASIKNTNQTAPCGFTGYFNEAKQVAPKHISCKVHPVMETRNYSALKMSVEKPTSIQFKKKKKALKEEWNEPLKKIWTGMSACTLYKQTSILSAEQQ